LDGLNRSLPLPFRAASWYVSMHVAHHASQLSCARMSHAKL
jgi:hypothetical protein